VAGQRIVQAGRVENWQSLVDDFMQAMQRLWN
jgi:hypothetical protein